MTPMPLSPEQLTLVKVSELPTFLTHLSRKAQEQSLWLNTDFSDLIGEMALSFKPSPDWQQTLEGKEHAEFKPLAVGVSLPIPYADELQLFIGFEAQVFQSLNSPDDLGDLGDVVRYDRHKALAKMWLLPRSARLVDEERLHTIASSNTDYTDLIGGMLLENEAVNTGNLPDFELKHNGLVDVFYDTNPEVIYLKNPVMSSKSPMGHVALLPSLMHLFGYILGLGLNELEAKSQPRLPDENLIQSCAHDLVSLMDYFVMPQPLLEQAWTSGRTNLDPSYQGPHKASHGVYCALAEIANVLHDVPFDTWDALTLTDLEFLASRTTKPGLFIKERLQAYVSQCDVVQLIPGSRNSERRKIIRVCSPETQPKWAVLNNNEKNIGNPDKANTQPSNDEVQLRDPRTYEPSIALDSKDDAQAQMEALTKLQGSDKLKLVLNRVHCPTAQAWLTALRPQSAMEMD